MSITDFAKNIDNLINKSIDKYSNTLISLTADKIRKATRTKNINDAIKKLTPSNNLFSSGSFVFLNKDIDNLKRITNKALKKEINAQITEVERLYNVSVGRSKFLKELNQLVDSSLARIPTYIYDDVLNAAMLTLTDQNTKNIAVQLSKTINKSIGQAKIVLKEALNVANRNYRDKIFQRIEKTGDKYLFIGPVDKRKSPPCTDWVEKVKTRAEWLKLKIDIFTNGGHFGCRDTMVLIPAGANYKEFV